MKRIINVAYSRGLTIVAILYTIFFWGVARADVNTAAVLRNWMYTVGNGKATIIAGTQTSGDVVIPSRIDGYPVVAVGGNFDCTGMTSLAIPESLTSVGVGFDYQLTSQKNWLLESDASNGNFVVYKSNAIDSGANAYMEITVKGPQVFSFDWKYSHNNLVENDLYYKSSWGASSVRISGAISDWQTVSCFVPAGEHTIYWQYLNKYGLDSYSWVRLPRKVGCPDSLKQVIVPAKMFEDVNKDDHMIKYPSDGYIYDGEDRYGNRVSKEVCFEVKGPVLSSWKISSANRVGTWISGDTGFYHRGTGVDNNFYKEWIYREWIPEGVHEIEFFASGRGKSANVYFNAFGGSYTMESLFPFLYHQITNVVLTGVAGNISQSSFDGCKALESIEIPDGGGIKAWNSAGWRFGTNGVLRSAKIIDNQDSEMILKLAGPGKLVFKWKASSEFYEDKSIGVYDIFDYAYLQVDEQPRGSLVDCKLEGVAIGGHTDWQQVELDILGEGPHKVHWIYVKDEMDDDTKIGEDCIWVDEIKFHPFTTMSFDIGNATGDVPSSVVEVSGTKINLPAYSGFNKTKYSLVGWSDGNAVYDPGSVFEMRATNATLRAVYEANTIAMPVIESSSVADGGVLDAASATISMSCDEGASIYYTLDGSTPTAASAKYNGAVEVFGLGAVVVKAVALRNNYFDSPVATFTYTRKPYTLAECLNVGIQNVSSYAPAWFRVQDAAAHDGNEALRSGAVGENESSTVEMTVKGNGLISFWWKVSCYDPRGRKYDHVAFVVDDAEVAWISGEKNWEYMTYSITGDGLHTLKWVYKKNGDSSVAGDDCAWLDEVTWIGGELFDITYENLKGATHQNPLVYNEGMSIKFTAPSVIDGYTFVGWTPSEITTSDTGDKVVTANWEWVPQDAVVDASVTGWKPVTVKADWVKTELERKFGVGKKESFITKFGDNLASAMTKKTGKRDVDGNELLVWHDYVAGTDPTDINSTFKAKIDIEDGKPMISWEPDLNSVGEERVYTVHGKETLSDIWHSPITALDHFFKVDVAMPREGTVTFDVGGGSSVNPISVRVGQEVGELPTPTRDGYTFAGWWTGQEGGVAVTPETVVTADMTIYAHWTIKSYMVVFDANGGNGGVAKSYTHGAVLGELPTPTREGYTFAGWWTAASSGAQVTVSTVVSADMTIYALWTIKSYTVVFDANGGNGGVTKSYTHGATLGELLTPTREGYTFAGWWTAANGGTQVTVSTVVFADMTIYAHWTIKSYTVVFNANGGNGDVSKSYTHGAALGELPTPTRDGYTFAGWWTAANGGNAVTAKTFVTADMTIYARWKLGAHDKVQLWENGPYWATTNIGAEKPEDYGYYFWWGDTVGYKRENDKWVASDGSNSNFSFTSGNTPTYNKDDETLQSKGWITADGVLAPERDAAQAHWGGDWRMPTHQEFDDLNNKCDWTWTTMNGVNGYVVRGRGSYASNSIFLPCAGYGNGTLLRNAGSNGDCWSSVPNSDSSYYAWCHCFYSGRHSTAYYYYRYYGQSVRPLQGFTK